MKMKKCMLRFWNVPQEFYLRIAFVLRIRAVYVEYLSLLLGKEGDHHSLKVKEPFLSLLSLYEL